jgi:threonine dehydrogenase-like Zn-dependent dehydrogenase
VRALTVVPGVEGSARIDDLPVPEVAADQLEVEALAVGICGTDREILGGGYGQPPEGAERLVLGHEAIGRVVRVPQRNGGGASEALQPGDLVVPIVRRPDPVPCGACASGEWDMCENGRFTEHGIRGADGFARERFPLEPRFAVPVPGALGQLGVLVEPASVVAKAWDHIERIGRRAYWRPQRVLVTGAGPVGLLAALMARQRGLETWVLDKVTTGPKGPLVEALGATYVTGAVTDCPPPDVVVECTGFGPLVLDAVEHCARSGIVCLAGLSSGSRVLELDATELNRHLVLENGVVFGTVNANRRHYDAAVDALVRADQGWLEGLVTRRVPLDRWADAVASHDEVKVVLEIGA